MYTPQQVKSQARLYIASNRAKSEECITLRQIAHQLGVSKSLLHKNLNERLGDIDSNLYAEYHEIAQRNMSLGRQAGGLKSRRGRKQQ